MIIFAKDNFLVEDLTAIANKLYSSEPTVSNHLQHIFEKLEVSSSVEAVTKVLTIKLVLEALL